MKRYYEPLFEILKESLVPEDAACLSFDAIGAGRGRSPGAGKIALHRALARNREIVREQLVLAA